MSFRNIFIVLSGLIILLLIILFIPRNNQPSPTVPAPVQYYSPPPGQTSIKPTPTPGGVGQEDEEFEKAHQEYIRSTQLLQKLPYGQLNFEVEYINEQHIIIFAKTTEKQRDYTIARQWFRDNNIDLSKITVDYK